MESKNEKKTSQINAQNGGSKPSSIGQEDDDQHRATLQATFTNRYANNEKFVEFL